MVFAVAIEVPAGVVTVTGTVPVPGGEVAVIDVSLLTVNFAESLPKCTLSAPVKPDPVIVTGVPPDGGPEVGEIELTVLGAMPLKASPFVSTAAQKLSEEQETDVRFGSLSPGTGVVLQVLPFQESALPCVSTATQKLEVGQETDVGDPRPCW